MYEDVTEEAYQELVAKRREENFIEDDGAQGASPDRTAHPRRRCGLAGSPSQEPPLRALAALNSAATLEAASSPGHLRRLPV